MKKYLLILVAILINCTIFAQVPRTINWQGILQDANGNNLDGNFNITVKLFDVVIGGTAVWTESHSDLDIDNGIANIVLGSVNPFGISFDKQYWLEITVGNGTPLPRIKLATVPYSLYSAKSNGVIVNDSLVLKDAQGVTRMVLNPNTGTFKMMNKDTVWYELSVQSPPKTKSQNGDGTYTTIQNGKEATHNRDGTLLHDRDRTSYDNANGKHVDKETTTYYDENGEVTSDNIKETYFDGVGTVSSEKSTYYNSDGQKSLEYKTQKSESGSMDINNETRSRTEFNSNGSEAAKSVYTYSKGKLVREEHFVNGNKTSEKEYDDQKTENAVYDGAGRVSRTVTQYQDQLKWTYVSGAQSTTQTQTQTGWTYQFGNNSNAFQIQSGTDNGFKLGLSSNKPTNPGIEFIPDDFGGYNKFTGSGVFKDDIVTDKNMYGDNANFNGDLNVGGQKNFRIDHPDDPENKYLYHSCIESDEVLNQYSGNVVTNSEGIAVVELADYIQKINIDFRYQLTVIGDFAQAIISKEIENNQFEIKTDKPKVKVSWMIIAKRNDKYMQEHPFEPVRLKNKDELNRINLLKNKGVIKNEK